MPIRVVIATASLTIREMLRMHLECLGCSIIAEAVDAGQALELFRVARPELMMIDTSVPTVKGIDSIQLLRTVRNESPATTIVIVTPDPSDPVAMQYDRDSKQHLRLDPGDRRSFNQMWRGLAAIYPELQRQ
jgi:DNA-binding NarL/FixJ family response regulator